MVTRKTPAVRIAFAAAFLVLALALVPVALAKGKPGGGSTNCTRVAPYASADNTYAWGSPGSYGLPGQTLTYAIDVRNLDAGCGSSSFTVKLVAPSGFAVSIPVPTVTLNSGSNVYVSAHVSSPSVIADGDYPVQISVQRVGDPTWYGPSANYYKVYSSDTIAPSLYWNSPWEGQVISTKGTTLTVAAESSDDHSVRTIDLYIDGAYKATTTCSDIAYACDFYYTWTKVTGTHTFIWVSTDWLGNSTTLTAHATVS
jgi:hypothetical protein